MKNRTGILVVDRLALIRRARRSTRTQSQLEDEAILREYRGFDGVAWPSAERPFLNIVDGLADESQANKVSDYLATLPNRADAEAILLASPAGAGIAHPGWVFYGFDLGYFDAEWSHFSVILNEVIFGHLSTLRSFRNVLNDRLLLPDLRHVPQILQERKDLESRGADVERDVQKSIEPVEIFGREDRFEDAVRA